MKIKEVIAATGLTDRAIRLYIEHGLLFPDTKENYNGDVLFAYDDSTNTVRYGYSYRLDTNADAAPYYETFNWDG